MSGPVVALATGTRNAPILPVHKFFLGDDITFEISVVDSTGAQRDITGFSMTWTLRETPNDPDTTLSKTAAIQSAGTGKARVTIAAADTVSLPARWYYYALRRTDSGSAETLAYGRVLLQKGPGA